MIKLALLSLAVAAVMLWAFRAYAQGDTDPDDPHPEWPGQKLSCNNYHDTAPDHKCNCARTKHRDCTQPPPNDTDLSGNYGMSAKCRTYCRPSHCRCVNNCTSWWRPLVPKWLAIMIKLPPCAA